MGNIEDERFAGTVLTDITAIHNPIATPTLKLSEVETSSSTVGLDVAKNKELFTHNNWKKYGIKKVTMVNAFFFFKFSSIEVFDSVLHDGPWMIREIPIFLNKWSPSEVATLNKATTFDMQKERQSTTPLAKKINVHEKQTLEGKIILLDDDGKPLKKVDYPGNTGSEDEVEQVDNETESYLASNLMRVGYGTNSLSEQLRVTAMDNDYDSYDDDVYECHDIFTTYRLYVMIELSRFVVRRRNKLLLNCNLVMILSSLEK
nr:hypothetical protein [Tanacetum cinerariifolium]GEW35529.1 hypothetical protein [Tanacetum cinerariifolium]